MGLEELKFLKIEMHDFMNNALAKRTAKAYSRNPSKYQVFYTNNELQLYSKKSVCYYVTKLARNTSYQTIQ